MKCLMLILIILYILDSSTARRRRSQLCQEKLDSTADMIFTGTVERVYRSRTPSYRGVVKVKRVLKGDTNFADNTVIVEGFGDSHICHSDVRERDTRIFVVSYLDNGHLRLNSSVVRVSVTNLDRAAAIVRGLHPKKRKTVTESHCEKMYCAYGAQCVVDRRTQQAHCRCQETCTDVFAPVCGSDSVTYSSDCQLRMASCTKQKRIFTKHQGPCDLKDPCEEKECLFGAQCQPSLDGRSAECICPEKCVTYGDSRSRPVCGTDGKDYPNVCELRRASCLEMRDIEVRYLGKCDPCEGVTCPNYQVCQLDDNRNPSCHCNDVCTTEHQPVCGSDGQTYSNECMMRVESCKLHKNLRVIYSGDCNSGTNPCELVRCGPGQECDIDRYGIASCQCPSVCEPLMQPICGSNSRTFDNECELHRQSCLLRQELTMLYNGECGEHGPCHTHHCSYGALCVVKNGQPVCECRTCAEEFDPVCGTDGISYTNPCKLKREACEQKTDIVVAYEGLCNTCHAQECDFYAVCETFGRSTTRCICPQVCIKVDAPVCGTDGVSYPNECELRVEACQKQQYIAVATKGTCDLCEHIHCKYGARCESGRCVCPTDCPEVVELVCATDGQTHTNECEMKRTACQTSRELSLQFYGACDEAENFEDDPPALKERKISSCQDKHCRFGGTCDFDAEGTPYCVCTFHCPAIKEPVCGSDGRMYDNQCRMREESCLLQKRIEPAEREVCSAHIDIPCDGEVPVVDPETGQDYFCGKGVGSKLCPAKTVCHVTQYFAKCCAEVPLIKSCLDTAFGCCPDGRTPILGPNNGGCPSVCNCNKLGSYSSTCDPVSKQCPCKPGVGGLRCDRCEPGFWGLHRISTGNSGCAHCNCNPHGSIRDDCEQTTGRCVCKHGVQGMKCDTCPSGSVLAPEGCVDESQVNATTVSCDEVECYHGATCLQLRGVAQCMCDFGCSPEDSRDPVCDFEGNTYGSECQMRLFSCRYQRPVNVKHYGVCRKPQKDETESTTSTTLPTRLPRRRSHAKRLDNKSTREVTINLPQNLFLTTRTSPTMPTTTHEPVLALAPDPFVEVEVPSFGGSSYLEMYKLEGYTRLSLEIEFKTFTDNGIVLYNGQTVHKSRDYISLSVKDRFVEFRYNLGSGSVILRSSQKIELGKWQKVVAKRYLRDGMLAIEGQEKVSGRSQGTLQSLDLAENLFVGFVPKLAKTVVSNVGVESGLVGCIRRLRIDRRDVNLRYPSSRDILQSSNIRKCTENACSKMPCRNGGTCVSPPLENFQCRCTEDFTGKFCETGVNPCSSNPCADGSTCIMISKGGFACKCSPGKTGKICNKLRKDFVKVYVPDFSNHSYLEMSTLQNARHALSIEIWFLARATDGVLLYNGQFLNSKGDFLAVNLVDGYVHFTYNLGSGIANLTSRNPIELYQWHTIKISRLRRQGTLKVNNETTVLGKSKAPLTELNLLLPLYIGGVPNVKYVHPESGVTKGLDGAIQRVVFNGDHWDQLTTKALRSNGVRKYRGAPCLSGSCLHGGVCIPELNDFRCRCHAKYAGSRCEKRIRKKDMKRSVAFNGTTFLNFSFKSAKDSRSRKSNRLQIRIRTSNPTGLLFWTSKGASLKGDFLALALVDGCPELSYNLGGQQWPVFDRWSIRNEKRVDDGLWHSIMVHRKKRYGEIRVDKGEPVSNSTETGATELNTDGTLWIGGAPVLPFGLPSEYYQGFRGCVDSVVIDKIPFHPDQSNSQELEFCGNAHKIT